MMHALGCPLPKECEALVMQEAITWLNNMDMQNVVIETDSQLVAFMINGNEEDITEFGEIVQSCRELLDPTHRVVFV
ncbi:hypothetical protein LINPERPRIM_LOCUS2849 [Linum perenne]